MSLDLLKKILKEKKVVFGTDRTIKKLKRGVCQKVFLSSNCPKETEEDIRKILSDMSVPESVINQLRISNS